MKSSMLALLATAPLLLTTACSQIGTGVAFGSFRSAEAVVPVVDGQEPGAQDTPAESIDDSVEEVPLNPGEVIDDEGNLSTDDGEVIVPACAPSVQVPSNYTLHQEGSNNVAGVGQTGANNSALIYQKGDSNTACVIQVGDNNKADVQQEGTSNTASVSQTGNNNNATVSQKGSGNSATIIQH